MAHRTDPATVKADCVFSHARGTAVSPADGRPPGGAPTAEVTIADPAPAAPAPSGFWLRPQCFSIHFVWHYMKTHGRLRYPIDKAMHRFAWRD